MRKYYVVREWKGIAPLPDHEVGRYLTYAKAKRVAMTLWVHSGGWRDFRIDRSGATVFRSGGVN